MKIRQIRNATLKITYADKTFLVDPWLMKKGAFGTFRNTPYRPLTEDREDIAMPMVDLPFPEEEVLAGVDAYVVTHFHPDHIDMEGERIRLGALDKSTPTFTRSAEDARFFWDNGFTDLTELYSNTSFGDVELIKTPCRHGTKVPCGPACGVVFRAQGEKTLYLAGDTIWYNAVEETIEKYQPEIIILYACGASLRFFGRLIMDQHDVLKVHKAAPDAKLVISHMESVAHATVTRSEMRDFAARNGFMESIVIPADGEILTF